MKFLVLVPYKITTYLEECQGSIRPQLGPEDHVAYLDDNGPNIGALGMIHLAIQKHNPPDDMPVVIVDGDDMLAPGALDHIREIYSDPNVWITYSGTQLIDGDQWMYQWSSQQFKNLRKTDWKCSHLASFRAGLYRKYLELDPERKHHHYQGQLIRDPYDIALFLPLFEMAGQVHTHAIQRIVYLYRRHPQNADLVNRAEMDAAGQDLYKRDPFPRVDGI